MTTEENKIVVFENQDIRRIWYNEEWWYVVNDIVKVLTDSTNVKDYIGKMRRRDNELRQGWGQIVLPLSVNSSGGKQKMNCANTKGILRIIQSIPSPKAEPFKQWLAQVGYERLEEEENPNLIWERLKQKYRDLGYDDQWINRRILSRVVRGELTEEWKDRGIISHREYAILTAEISKGTFGVTPSEHKTLKKLKRESLRDHMTNEELIFMMLGEEATKHETIRNDHQGFAENKIAAIRGGDIAGKARATYEEQTGKQVVSSQNFKQQINAAKKQRKLESKKKKI